MPIIRSTDIIRGVNIIPVGDIRLNDNCDDDIRLDDIRMLAEQVLCCTEDMQCAEGDDDSALILPIRLLPKSVRTLNNSFHKKMGNFMRKWASGRGFRIEPRISNGPTIMWLKRDHVNCRDGWIAIFIVVPRPTTGREGTTIESGEAITIGESPAAPQEPPSSGLFKSPMTASLSLLTVSRFNCQVGDIIILEGGEQLAVEDEGTEPRDICMFCVMHRTSRLEAGEQQ